MKLTGERGNAIVEFVILGLIGQLLLFGFLIRLGVDFRSQIAAESIARQTLRSAQLSGNQVDMAQQAAAIFGIPPNEVQVSYQDSCNQLGLVAASVKVRNKQYVAKGFCVR